MVYALPNRNDGPPTSARLRRRLAPLCAGLIAAALAMGPVSAGNLAGLAWTLGMRLPGIGRLLADGTLTRAKARLIATTFEPLDEGEAVRAEALILPDPATRFARSAARLAALSSGHPMMEWLRFMRQLTEAQHAIATTLPPFAGLPQAEVERAVESRMPPLAADGHRRDPAWRDGLILLLDRLDSPAIPAPAQAAMTSLRHREAAAIEALADGFLRADVDGADAGAALYVAAALQVYFTRPDDPFRLVLTDVVMPGMGGVELARRLLRRDAGVRVLFMSGHVSPEFTQPDFSQPFELLSKPCSPEQLARAVRGALDRPGRARKNGEAPGSRRDPEPRALSGSATK